MNVNPDPDRLKASLLFLVYSFLVGVLKGGTVGFDECDLVVMLSSTHSARDVSNFNTRCKTERHNTLRPVHKKERQ